MFKLFEKKTIKVLYNAQILAHRFGHPYTGPEHILLSILRSDSFASRKLSNRGVNYQRVEYLLGKIPYSFPKTGKVKKNRVKWDGFQIKESFSSWLRKILKTKKQNDLPKFSHFTKKILRKCFLYNYRRRELISVELVLAVLLLRRKGICAKILEDFSVRYDLIVSDLHFHMKTQLIENHRLIFSAGKVRRIPTNSYFFEVFSQGLLKTIVNYYRSVFSLLPTTKKISRINMYFLKKRKGFPKIIRSPKLRRFFLRVLEKKYKTVGIKEAKLEFKTIIPKYIKFIRTIKKKKIEEENKNVSKFLFLKNFLKNFDFSRRWEYFFYPSGFGLYRDFRSTYKKQYNFYLSYKRFEDSSFFSYKDVPIFQFPFLKNSVKNWKKIKKKEIKKKKN